MVRDRTLQDAHRYGGVEIPTSGFTQKRPLTAKTGVRVP
jgi:hypothetical protein